MPPFLRRLCALAAFSVLAAPVARASAISSWQPEAAVRVGTLGIGPEIGVRIPHSDFGLRANLNIFSYSDDDLYSHGFSDADALGGYDVHARFGGALRLLNGGLTADWYPLGSGLRLSAGVYANGDRITASAHATGTARVGAATYRADDAGTVSAKALTNSVAPYFGLGYEGLVAGSLFFAVDAGVLVEGSPRVSASAEGPVGTLPAFNDELQRQSAKVAHDVDVPVYPVLELGLGWRF